MATVDKVLFRNLDVVYATLPATWTEAGSITLTEDGDWLILCSFWFTVASISDKGAIRLHKDNSVVLHYGELEDRAASITNFKPWMWMSKITRSGTDVQIDLDIMKLATASCGIKNRILIALKLDDMGVEDTDWRWNEDDAELDINTIWTDLLTEAWTPGTEEDWLIMASAEWQPGSTGVSLYLRLDRNAEAFDYDETLEEGEDPTEWRSWASIRVLTLPTSTQTFKLQAKEESASTQTARRMRFFAVRTAVFDQVVEFRDDTYAAPSSADVWEEKLDAYFTPNQQEDVLILGHCGTDIANQNYQFWVRAHEEETEELLGPYAQRGYDATDILAGFFADIKNWAASQQNADLDIKASNTGVTFGDACVIFVSLTLAEALPLIKVMTTETVGLSEADLRRDRSVRLMAETVGLAEVVVLRMRSIRLMPEVIGVSDSMLKTIIKQMAETVGLSEGFVRRMWSNRFMTSAIGLSDAPVRRMWSVRLVTATEGILETLLRRGRSVRVQTTETVSIQETMLRFAGFVKVMATEVVGISEVFVRRMWAIRLMTETEGIVDSSMRRLWAVRLTAETEGIVDSPLRRARSVRLMTETVSISETLLRVAAAVKVMTTETVGIFDTMLRVAGFAKVMTTEVVGLSEVAVRRMRSVRQMVETVPLSEAAVKRMRSVRQMASTINISDSSLRRDRSVRQMASTVDISDSLLRRARSIRLMTETVSITETFVRAVALVKMMASTVGIPEAVVRRARSVRQMIETISVPDVSVRRMRAVRQMADTISIVESFVRRLYAPYLVKIMDETMTIAETTVRRMRTIRLMESTVTVVESWVRRSRMVRIITEVLSIVERWLSWLWKPVDIIELDSLITPSVDLDSSVSTGVELDSPITPGVDLESEVP